MRNMLRLASQQMGCPSYRLERLLSMAGPRWLQVYWLTVHMCMKSYNWHHQSCLLTFQAPYHFTNGNGILCPTALATASSSLMSCASSAVDIVWIASLMESLGE